MSEKIGIKNEKWSLKFKKFVILYEKLRKIGAKIIVFDVKRAENHFFFEKKWILFCLKTRASRR
ncbi:hypothetical protein B7990_10010 [Fibrobacter sp. UWB4]|nr:hypothetical protein B7990_10010 [Fibrobacter sp. UWB4]